MGWCHEFGPQIADGCEHPMVAGTSSCTCTVCGTVCTGRFSGCDDVWADGPRPVVVSIPPRRPPAALPALEAQPDLDGDVAAREDPGIGAMAAAPDQPTAARIEGLTRRLEELEARVDRQAESPASPGSDAGPAPSPADDVGARLERLGSEVSALGDLPARMAALEGSRAAPAPAPSLADKAVVVMSQRLDRLTARVAELDAPGRLRALDEVNGRIGAIDQVLAELVREMGSSSSATALAGLGDRVAALEESAELMAAGEAWPGAGDRGDEGVVAKGLAEAEARLDTISADVAQLALLPDRMAELAPLAPRLGDLEAVVEGLGGDLQELSSALTVMRDLSERVEALCRLPERMAAFDKVLFGLLKGLEQVSADAGGVTDVARRVAELEASTGLSDEVVGKLAERIDRLSTLAGAVEDAPERLAALERTTTAATTNDLAAGLDELGRRTAALAAAVLELPRHDDVVEEVTDRTSALARGLGGAIDMIDQLSAQVAALEHAVVEGGLAPRAHPASSVPSGPATAGGS